LPETVPLCRSLSTNSMSIILILLIGLLLGFLSQFLTKRRDPGSFVTRMIVGLLCATLAVVLSSALDLASPLSLLVELAVIVGLLAIYQFIFWKRNAA
jgi:uncharacterized membrane protein YeaQ/YmgE (transglycosylase-associated protein family)